MTHDQPDHRTPSPWLVQDPLTGRPVFVAPQRGGKPDDRALRAAVAAAADPRDWCPFCAGNESATPPATIRVPADESLPWRARIVPNAFPIAAAPGVHDVVIESSQHHRSIVEVPADTWREAWALCRERLAGLATRPGIAWATVFKNSGPAAGASLEHVHSQLIGLGVVPPVMEAELAAVRRDRGSFARLLAEARSDDRVVAESGGLVALVPPAARQPYETWIVSAAAEPHVHSAADGQVAALADLTRELAARFERLAPGCQFNWWLHQAPFRTADEDPAIEHWHWHLEVLPRLAELAGFEIGTGCHITTLAPAEAAHRLRAAARS
jgi:UDPglucose--hexose-1-phosphate uridylyltransferase